MAKLSAVEVQQHLKESPGWSLNAAGEITKSYKLSGFTQALVFVNAVGLLAESTQHHPDILIKYRQVTLTLSTHDEGGLTDKDFQLATLIDALQLI